MSFAALLNATCTVLVASATTPNEYGSQVHEWEDGETHPCYVEQSTESETQGGQDTSSRDLKVWVGPAAEITATDRLRIRGATFEVIGGPRSFTRPIAGSAVHHYELTVRRVDG